MPYKVTISDGTVLEKSIETITYNVDPPPDNPYCMRTYAINSMQITGRIDTGEKTIRLCEWSLIPANDPDCYKEIEVEQTYAGQILRIVKFSKAFVVDYSESYSIGTGFGYFSILIRQLAEVDIGLTNKITQQPAMPKIEAANAVEESSLPKIPGIVTANPSNARNNRTSITDMLAKKKAVLENGFKYEHNPSNNSKVLMDAIEDPNAVYGYRPNPASESIGGYADACDWTNPEEVAKATARREAYHQKNDSIDELIIKMQSEEYSTEDIAREANKQRNENRLNDYVNDPEGLERVMKRNQEKYGSPYGLSADDAYKKYGSWEKVIEKTKSANAGMDACCGLYDKYYHLYPV
jgi:hypothetical protein